MAVDPSQVWHGVVKTFNPTSGWGHIECADTFAIFGKDIFLLKSQLKNGAPSIAKGAQVQFKITDNGRGPEATEVMETGNVNNAAGPSYFGTIKSFNPTSGWGHIACDDTLVIYHKDIFFLKSAVPGGDIAKGTEVEFRITPGQKGPEAVGLRPLTVVPRPAVNIALQHLQYQQRFAANHQLNQQYGQNQQWKGDSTGGQMYYGTLKSFNPEKGWGHIECVQTREVFQKDMFVMKSALAQCPSVAVGDLVAFQVVMGTKGPEAANVKSAGGGGVGAGSIHYGTIKSFNEKGFGFIDCAETRETFGKDIFIHRNALEGYVPQVGEAVVFSVQISSAGRPEATSVQFGQGQGVPTVVAPPAYAGGGGGPTMFAGGGCKGGKQWNFNQWDPSGRAAPYGYS